MRRVFLLVFAWILLALAVALGLLGALIGFLLTATLFDDTRLLSAAALMICLAVSIGLAWIAGRWIAPAHRGRLALAVGGGTTLCVVLLASLTIFRSFVPSAGVALPVVPPDVRYWDLPTGSRIAYLTSPAAERTAAPPLVFLHGGPAGGIVGAKMVVAAISSFSRDGFDVYIYDQIGGGLSARLTDIEEYTVSRHVEDLESIRSRLGTATMILIGESWGGELATHYAAAYPEHVDRLILVSPGSFSSREWGGVDPCDLVGTASKENRERFNNLLSLRFLISDLLLDINPGAAHDFLPDEEGDAIGEEMLSLLLDGMVCDPARIPDDTRIGISMWAYTMTDIDREKIDVEELAGALVPNDIPVLIFKGECDYCLWEVSHQYEQLFPNSTLLYIEGAGHILYVDKPRVFHDATRAFLLGEPLPVQPYIDSEPPPGVKSTLDSNASRGCQNL